jgi:uncharacterized protein (DUF1810 family)
MANRVDPTADPYHLQRFVDAQAPVHDIALAELRAGRKRSHWMWFVFPQIAGLGRTEMAARYAIASLAEARAYLAHPVLGPRLVECVDALLGLTGRSAHEIMGSPDDLKLRSSATLFAVAAGAGSPLQRLLDVYYAGEPDARTLALLQSDGPR